MPNGQLEQLLSLAQAGKRVCPVPQKWNELWELLPQRKRVGAGWEPPLPLILGAWGHTSDAEKQSRFLSHIRWAADHGALGTISAFIDHWNQSTGIARNEVPPNTPSRETGGRMLRYTCWTCAFTFYDADRSWDSAIDSGRCPKCSEPLYDFPVSVSGHKANPKALYEAVIGEKNRIYYITKFEQFDQQGAWLEASWNWAAFLVGIYWVVYRKMYGWVFAFMGVAFLSGIFKSMAASDPGNTITAWLGAVVILAPLIVFAIFADSLYYNRVKKKIAAAQLSIKDETELLRFLRYKGGVNTWVVWVGISLPVIGILAAIAIPAYGRMSRQGGELFLAALFFAALFLAGAFVWLFVMKKTAGGGKRIPSSSPSEDRTSSPRTEIHSMKRVASDAVYLQIRTELNSGSPDVATWTRAQGDAEGNAERAKALYIKYRAERLLAASRTASTHQ